MFRLLSILILSVSINLFYCSNDSLITINASNPTVVPFLNVRINTTSKGTFKLVYPGAAGQENQNTVKSFPAAWMQDDANTRLYISNGDRSQNICVTEYWFVKGKHYVREYPTFNCSEPAYECITGYGYEEEVSRYNSTYFGYMGRSYVYRFQREVDIYAARALDGVGPLTCMMYIGVNDSSYVGLSILNDNQVTGNSSIMYFNEYFYDDIKMGQVPNASYFEIPQGLLDFEATHNCTSYPYDLHTGTKITNNTSNTNGTNGTNGTNNNNGTNGNGSSFTSRLTVWVALIWSLVLLGIFI